MAKNPISIQFLMVVKKAIKGYTSILKEHFENADSIVVVSSEGMLGNYPIENRESESDSESESFYVDLLIKDMNELKEQKQIFAEPKGIFLETNGELVEVNHLVQCSIVEVAEHTEFDTVFYDTITLEPLED